MRTVMEIMELAQHSQHCPKSSYDAISDCLRMQMVTGLINTCKEVVSNAGALHLVPCELDKTGST